MLTAMSVEEEQQKFAAPEAVEMYKNVFEGLVKQAMSESRNHRQPMYKKASEQKSPPVVEPMYKKASERLVEQVMNENIRLHHDEEKTRTSASSKSPAAAEPEGYPSN